jgi:hypothetical protein
MKAEIRAKIYADHVPIRVRIAPRKSTPYDLRRKARREEKQSNSLPTHMFLDRQTEEQKARRELEAKAELYRFHQRLANAVPSDSRCIGDPACPFRALLDGMCRAHAMDRYAQMSLLGSSLNVGLEWTL